MSQVSVGVQVLMHGISNSNSLWHVTLYMGYTSYYIYFSSFEEFSLADIDRYIKKILPFLFNYLPFTLKAAQEYIV